MVDDVVGAQFAAVAEAGTLTAKFRAELEGLYEKRTSFTKAALAEASLAGESQIALLSEESNRRFRVKCDEIANQIQNQAKATTNAGDTLNAADRKGGAGFSH
jgi:hypothetical protein